MHLYHICNMLELENPGRRRGKTLREILMIMIAFFFTFRGWGCHHGTQSANILDMSVGA